MSVEFKDYYATLGVPRDADDDAIKKAFRKSARKYHPDVAKDKKAGEAKFKEINEAHEVLSDPQKRKRYDELGANWKEGAAYQRPTASQQGPRASSGGKTQDFHFGGTGFSDFFEEMFARNGESGFSFEEGGRGAGQSSRSHGGVPGNDVEGDILVTLNEVLHGAVRDISLASTNPQSGQTQSHQFKVRIPAGVAEGQRIRVPGKGGEGFGMAKAGDLYLRVRLAAHPDFQVRGADLYYDLDLAPWESVLGTTAKVPTLTGEVNVRIPPGTNNGQQLRVPKHGLPTGKSGTPGNLYVTVDIQLPKTINDEERALWVKLGQVSTFAARKRA
ncbi:curved DNA-binding protein [Verrucomicrobium sp. GAS474]|uniref:DnaJ C-terminal domain-containing protein n=1 Tax=Verrucomicrobium sp. GAS474 TaxID=1882831 RepID=UPI00087CE0D4|nr:DnaJ C-terminal domain-containing protein [Verrucomicrobium sp. GAS474]SDU18621.1 curved DNA-binding protein [Verrucomicrobium sp. GAS474]